VIGYDRGNMTHEYEGRYRTKHAPGSRPDPDLERHLRSKAKEGHLPCSSAFAAVEKTGATPAEIGRAADLLELKITKCQLGLFGYGKGKRNIVEPAQQVSEGLAKALREAVVDGRLSCLKAWDIARQFGLSKMEITAACERLSVPLGPCQLGTF
jgi:hypothetical protein